MREYHSKHWEIALFIRLNQPCATSVRFLDEPLTCSVIPLILLLENPATNHKGASGDTTQRLFQNFNGFIQNDEPYARLPTLIRPRTRSGKPVAWQFASIDESIVNLLRKALYRGNQSSPRNLRIGRLLHDVAPKPTLRSGATRLGACAEVSKENEEEKCV